jgi:hypothetical protein
MSAYQLPTDKCRKVAVLDPDSPRREQRPGSDVSEKAEELDKSDFQVLQRTLRNAI